MNFTGEWLETPSFLSLTKVNVQHPLPSTYTHVNSQYITDAV